MAESPAPALIDIGANLTHESFRADLDAVLARAHAHGVTRMLVTGASRQGSRAALALAQRYPGTLYATAGIHPHLAGECSAEAIGELRALAAHAELRAIGETGLDYWRDFAPRPQQRTAFQQQLELAAELGLPLFLHQRDAHADFLALLKPMRAALGNVVVHCFTDSRQALFDYLDLDCHIGITGWICDERRGTHLRELVAAIPAERLLLETDAPYLLPRNLVPKPSHRRNEPMYLAHICREVATCRHESAAATAAASTRAASAFFHLPAPAAGIS